MLNVTVVTAPLKPPKMYCTNCQWDSITGEPDQLLTDGGQPADGVDRRCVGCDEIGPFPKRKVPSDHGTEREPICDDCEEERR